MCIKQTELTKVDEVAAARGTMKVASLVGDPECNGLVAVSLYDQKPFYFLSNSHTKVEWIEKTKEVWSNHLKKKLSVPYHRLNLVDNYNYNMNMVDLADQLRDHYLIDRWMIKRKWWWEVFFWCYEMLLTNSYVLYCKYYRMHKLKPITHYEFQRSVALVWINPKKYWPNLRNTNIKVKPPKRPCTRLSDNTNTPCRTLSTTPTTDTIDSTPSHTISLDNTDRDEKKTSFFTRNTIVNDASLDPFSGTLVCRLIKYNQHLPCPPPITSSYCQLHKWETGEKTRKGCIFCTDCRITLCDRCYIPFHTVENLVGMKEILKLSYRDVEFNCEPIVNCLNQEYI